MRGEIENSIFVGIFLVASILVLLGTEEWGSNSVERFISGREFIAAIKSLRQGGQGNSFFEDGDGKEERL